MFQCSECGKSFKHFQNLEYHQSHKVCQKVSPRICPDCGQMFASKQKCQYHIDHGVCSKRKTVPEKVKSPSSQTEAEPESETEYGSLSRGQLIERLAKSESRCQTLEEHPRTVNQVNLIFPVAYGREDMGKVTEKLGDVFGPLLKNHPFESIPRLFSEIHKNRQLPEYHNIYTDSEQSKFVLISDGRGFEHHPKKTIIDQIIEEKRSLLNKYVDDNGEQLGEKVLKKYERYQEQIDGDSDFRKTLEIEIAGLLLDMKKVIANDEKTRRLLEKVDRGDFEIPPDDENQV
jgi:hypothetical protein